VDCYLTEYKQSKDPAAYADSNSALETKRKFQNRRRGKPLLQLVYLLFFLLKTKQKPTKQQQQQQNQIAQIHDD